MNDHVPSAKAIALRTGGHLAAIVPQSLDDVYRLATMAFRSGMLKPLKTGYGDTAQVEDADATLARGTMIIMQGMEIGVPPMQSIQLLAMINGRIVAHSEAVPGILLAHGFKIKKSWTGTEMQDDWTAHCELTRPDGSVYRESFSVKDAKQAKLWDQSPTITKYGKTKPNDSAWYCYPKRLMWARALGFASKDGASDKLKGIQIREEAEDMERIAQMQDITPQIEALDIPDAPPPPVPEVEIPDPPLADDQPVLDRLTSLYSECESEEELKQIKIDNADLINRLSPAGQSQAWEILGGKE